MKFSSHKQLTVHFSKIKLKECLLTFGVRLSKIVLRIFKEYTYDKRLESDFNLFTMSTRFDRIRQKTNQELKKKLQFFTKKFTTSLVYLFLGFLIGNLFGTLIDFFRLILWDGFIIVAIILLFEGVSFLNYGFILNSKEEKMNQESVASPKRNLSILTSDNGQNLNISFFSLIIKSLNFLKLGILLGFFIDAFKVGS